MAILLLILIYGAFISLGLPDSLLGVAWPVMQPAYGVPYDYAGILSVVMSGATILSGLMSVRVLRRYGTGRVTLVSVLLTAVALLGISFAPSFWWMMVLCIPLGLGAGAVDSGLNAYVAQHYKSRHMSWLHCFWGVGAMLGPAIMSRYIGNGGFEHGYRIISFVQFALVALLLFSIPLWDRVSALPSPAVAPDEEKTDKPPDSSGRGGLLYALRIKGTKLAMFSFLFYCGIETTIGLWGSSFLIGAKGLDAVTAAQWVSLYFGGITLGRFLTGFATMKMSNKALIRFGELAILAGTVLLTLPLPMAFSMAGFILVGFGCAPIFPCMLHETPARFGRENAQAVMSLQIAIAYVGCSLLPPLFGFVATATTILLFPLFILLYIAAMLLCTEALNLAIKRIGYKPFDVRPARKRDLENVSGR